MPVLQPDSCGRPRHPGGPALYMSSKIFFLGKTNTGTVVPAALINASIVAFVPLSAETVC